MPSYDTNLAKLSCQGMIHYENNELYVEAYKSVNKDKLDINVYYPICNQIVS
jgi:phosphodiesterase/alkaline phosphatase D-like protein